VAHTTQQPATGAGASWAEGPDAPQRAVRAAIAALGAAAPRLVLAFPDAALPAGEAAACLAAAAGGAPVAGMTSDGLLTTDGLRVGGCWALALGEGVTARVGLARDAAADLRAAGRRAAAEAVGDLELPPGRSVVLLFVDPASGDEGEAVDGAYDVVGPRAPLAGGGANGRPQALFAGAEAAADAVVAVAVVSAAPVAVGVAHGCRPRGFPAIVTRTEGRAVRELDGRPAEAVYLEALGHPGAGLDEDAFERLAILHPLAQPELRGELRLRHVHGRAPAGGLACATHLSPNAAVWFCEQSPHSIIASARLAVRDAAGRLGAPARATLVFDCAARKRALGGRLEEEARAVAGALDEESILGGLYTRGEVGRARGAKGDLNHAIVAVAFA
jgi:hypothetical protein